MKRKPPDVVGTAAALPGPAFPPWLVRAAPLLLVAGAWLLTHPYAGIVHDARLYAAQALRELNPVVFDRDMFFAFGSQDEFTLFTRLFAPLSAGMGLSAAAMALVAVGHLLWLSGAFVLARRLAGPGPTLFVGLLLVAALPATYGGWQTFAFGEGFATPRPLAEGLGMWALWALTRGRLVVSGLLVVAAGLLHPLMAIAVALAGFVFVVLRNPRWIAVGLAGCTLIAAGALSGVAPFDRIGATMDAEWLAVVEPRNAYLFPGMWLLRDWSRFTMTLALALAGASVLMGWRRTFVLAVAAAALIGVGVTYIGADLLHNVFLIQLQLYRAMWLLTVVAYLCAGILLARVWTLQDDGYAIAALLLLGIFITFVALPAFGVAVLSLGLLIAVLRLHGLVRALPRPTRHLLMAVAIPFAGGLLLFRIVASARKVQALGQAEDAPLLAVANISVIDVAIVAIAAMLLLRHRPQILHAALPVAALAVFAVSLILWDRRDNWSSLDVAMRPDWSLPADAQIFWENSALGPWLVLQRPSYVSSVQGAGIAFTRDTALAFDRRIDIVQPLMQLEMKDIYRRENAAHVALPELERSTLAAVCAQDAGLHALVLSRAVEGSYAAAWDTPIPLYDVWAVTRGIARPPIRRFYLYRCDDLREGTTSTALTPPRAPESSRTN